MEKAIIIGITIVAIIIILCFVTKESNSCKWSCNEGQCEKIIDGDFTSLEKCKKHCAKRKDCKGGNCEKKISFAKERIVSTPKFVVVEKK